MYTNTNPELRRIVPDAKGRPKIKVVYVVLEAQYQSALTKAVQNINGKRENVRLCLSHHVPKTTAKSNATLKQIKAA